MLHDLDDTEEIELADGRCAGKTDMKVRFGTSKIRSNYEFLRGIIGVVLNSFSGMCRRRNGHFACGETTDSPAKHAFFAYAPTQDWRAQQGTCEIY